MYKRAGGINKETNKNKKGTNETQNPRDLKGRETEVWTEGRNETQDTQKGEKKQGHLQDINTKTSKYNQSFSFSTTSTPLYPFFRTPFSRPFITFYFSFYPHLAILSFSFHLAISLLSIFHHLLISLFYQNLFLIISSSRFFILHHSLFHNTSSHPALSSLIILDFSIPNHHAHFLFRSSILFLIHLPSLPPPRRGGELSRSGEVLGKVLNSLAYLEERNERLAEGMRDCPKERRRRNSTL